MTTVDGVVGIAGPMVGIAPATGDLMGTPASIMARLLPHTLAMELEPLDSVISETTRML